MGRHIEFKTKYVKKALFYLDNYEEIGDAVPTIEGLADYLGVSKKSIYNWTKQDENGRCIAGDKFLHATMRISTRQGRLLQNGGLTGKFKEGVTKLMLSANHDMKEKTDITTNDKSIGGLRELDEQTLRHLAKGSDGGTSKA